jgi:hypothetical protein
MEVLKPILRPINASACHGEKTNQLQLIKPELQTIRVIDLKYGTSSKWGWISGVYFQRD